MRRDTLQVPYLFCYIVIMVLLGEYLPFIKKKNFNSKTHKYTLAFVIGLGILEILIIIANQDLRFITIIQSSFHINNFI